MLNEECRMRNVELGMGFWSLAVADHRQFLSIPSLRT